MTTKYPLQIIVTTPISSSTKGNTSNDKSEPDNSSNESEGSVVSMNPESTQTADVFIDEKKLMKLHIKTYTCSEIIAKVSKSGLLALKITSPSKEAAQLIAKNLKVSDLQAKIYGKTA